MTPDGPGGYDLVVVHPGAAHGIYGALGDQLTAVEPPLWARILAAYARDRGWSVAVVDAEAEGLSPLQAALEAWRRRPRLVAIAVYGHQPSASTQQMYAAGALARSLKTVSPAKVLMLGGHVSALPERTLREEAVDYVAVGEGPATVDALLRGLPPGKVPGLGWRGAGGEVTINPAAPLLPLEELHGGVWDRLPMARYRAHNWHCFGDLGRRQPYASIHTSLGCVFKCSFCCINAPFGTNRYRTRAPADVVEEVRLLHDRYGVSTIKVVDEMFVLNERHYLAVAEGLAALPCADDLNLWAYARVDTVKSGNLAALRRGGVRWLALGIESGSAHVRDGANKRLRNDDIVGVVRAVQAAGISVIGNYIFGLPDDDEESMRATLALARECRTEFANFYSAMAYPGSPLHAQAEREGWTLPGTWRGYSQHNDDCRPLDTRHVSAATVLRHRDEAFRAYFSDPAYQDMVGGKFGQEAVDHVKEMLGYKLKRKLLEAA